MDAQTGFIIPDILPYLVAILALLVVWQYHQMQVLKGRILAVDIFDRSGVRMYLFVVPADKSTCSICRESHGKAFLPSVVAKKHFTPLRGQCSNPMGCGGLLVGIYGAWPEARQAVERLRAAKSSGTIQLSGQEISAFINGPWECSISAAADRVAVHMLEAMVAEESKPDTAMRNYRYVIEQAKEMRHLPFVVPAYFRLVELLTRQGRYQEVVDLIGQFESRYKDRNTGPYVPTETQRGLMSIRKSRLAVQLKPAL
jgi:hypothetical protein